MTDDDEPQQVRRWLVNGTVQGVGFRVFVMREATKLRLRGKVHNTSEGAVDVVAIGPGGLLDQLESRLLIGPEMAEVHSVDPIDPAGPDGDAASIGNTFMITG